MACPVENQQYPEYKINVIFDNCSQRPLKIYALLKTGLSSSELKLELLRILRLEEFKKKAFYKDVSTLLPHFLATKETDWNKQRGTHRTFCFDEQRISSFVCKHFVDIRYRKKKVRLLYNHLK